jgi:hypothetical protein
VVSAGAKHFVLVPGSLVLAVAVGMLATRAVQFPRPTVGDFAATALAPQLPASDGYVAIPGLVRIGQGSDRLWSAKDGTGPYTPAELGMRGGLGQTWVSRGAVKEWGTRVPLPLPAAYVHRFSHAILELDVSVLAFDNARAPLTLLHNPQYNHRYLVDAHAAQALPVTIHDGVTIRFPDPDHNGETEFLFTWARGDYWNQVAIEGRGITAVQARGLAERGTAANPAPRVGGRPPFGDPRGPRPHHHGSKACSPPSRVAR